MHQLGQISNNDIAKGDDHLTKPENCDDCFSGSAINLYYII